jgi:hypothetical protein
MGQVDQMKEERSQLLERRALMKKEMEIQKFQIQQKIEKVKQGKLDPALLRKELEAQDSLLTFKSEPYSLSLSKNKSFAEINKTSQDVGNRQSRGDNNNSKSEAKAVQQEKSERKGKVLEARENVLSGPEIREVVERQNKEMLKLLIEEQKADNRRE